ncbi:phosphatases II [Lentinus brumalis]|uniref:Phosphatases II n=1 Tax=Lentinus brumalis TaxID=2498619 RepID=A0A371D340_9APHY|nr:phosphatases II [Polyporus brumalis]
MSRCPQSARFSTDATDSPGPSPLQEAHVTQIIPRLYIGDLAAAESPEVLSSLGITHILSAMRGPLALPSPSMVPQIPPHHRLQVPLLDTPFSELVEYLPQTTQFIADALARDDACVLVHCAQGISRSASVVAAYFIAAYACSPEQAVQWVKHERQCAQPNVGFISQLGEYAQSLRYGDPVAVGQKNG